jgi:hypothetical protein
MLVVRSSPRTPFGDLQLERHKSGMATMRLDNPQAHEHILTFCSLQFKNRLPLGNSADRSNRFPAR